MPKRIPIVTILVLASFAVLGGCGSSDPKGADTGGTGDSDISKDSFPDLPTVFDIHDTFDPGRPEDEGASDDGVEDSSDSNLDVTEDTRPGDASDVATDEGPVDCHEFLCACKTPSDCFSGICVETPGGAVCSNSCADESSCPTGWLCKPLENGQGPDTAWGCLPPPKLCRPCKTDGDCSGSAGGTCIELGTDGRYCGSSCSDSTRCPEGFKCQGISIPGGNSTKLQCVPESGECPCGPNFIEQGFVTECYRTNEFGTCKADRKCDQTCSAATPGKEICDGVDNDCNGQTDDDLTMPCYTGPESTRGVGACHDGTLYCVSAEWTQCAGEQKPQSQEFCGTTDAQGNLIDDDCNGQTDTEENASGCIPYFRDTDQDTYGVDGDTKCLCRAVGAYSATRGGDCVDDDARIHPGAVEVCNGKDDNCNLLVDEENADNCKLYYRDHDLDSFGDPSLSKCLCEATGEYTTDDKSDCDDSDLEVNPLATERCNSKDDNCDGTTDELSKVCTTDCGDGSSTCTAGRWGECSGPLPLSCTDYGTCTTEGMCVTTCPTPPTETCNGLDDDCDGTVDGMTRSCSSLCETGTGTETCVNGQWFGCTAQQPLSCMDYATCTMADICVTTCPVAPAEICNGIDDDCNGQTDEVCAPTGIVISFASAYIAGSDGTIRMTSLVGQAGPVGRSSATATEPGLCQGLYCLTAGF